MGLIPISEFQIAFGYFNAYMNLYKPKDFYIPSLQQEGSKGNIYSGADLVIDSNLVIQFKRPTWLCTNNIREFGNGNKPSELFAPLYRFEIKNDDPTNQLESLINTASNKNILVQYISPVFKDESEFFNSLHNPAFHIGSYAHINVLGFKSMLKTIGNNNDHTVIYNADTLSNNSCYCFSEPKKIVASKGFDYEPSIREEQYLSNIMAHLYANFFPEDNSNEIWKVQDPLAGAIQLQNKLLAYRDVIWCFSLTGKVVPWEVVAAGLLD